MTSDDAEVITAIDGRLGRMTLHRPRAINAVSHSMLPPIAAALASFAADPDVVAVLIDGAGERGFCAGSDIQAIYESLLAGTGAAVDYRRDEYQVNQGDRAIPQTAYSDHGRPDPRRRCRVVGVRIRPHRHGALAGRADAGEYRLRARYRRQLPAGPGGSATTPA